MKVLKGTQRKAFLIFFASHIPITLLVDGQALLSTLFPQFLRDLIEWYCDVFGDVLMRYPSPPWFQALVASEFLVQVPFFVVACHVLTHEKYTQLERYPRWFQTLCIIYGSSVSTTLVPILPSFWTSDAMTSAQIAMTTGFYAPYLLFPLALLYLAARDDFAEVLKPVTRKND